MPPKTSLYPTALPGAARPAFSPKASSAPEAAPPPVRLGQVGGIRFGPVGGLRVGDRGGIRARPR